MKKRYVLMSIGVGILGGAALYTARKQAPVDAPRVGFEWISARNEVNPTQLDEPEPKPMFYVGDEILLFNPYQGALYADNDIMEPEHHEITDVTYDEDDEVFRYELDGVEDEWVSEDWLSLPMSTKFKKQMTPTLGADEVTPEVAEAERKILHKVLDDGAKMREIDRLLDVMNEGTSAERADAKRRLEEMAK